MSLILPSFELIPGKFNVGSLFAQIPMDGSADLTVTRGSDATRFNASGNVQVMGSGIPRLDYYTSGGVTGCPALLVEPSAQNQCQQSEAFNNVFWFPALLNAFGSGSVANTTATRDPYGTNVADYIQEDSTPSSVHIVIGIFAGNVSGTTYTWSVFAKAAERTIINLLNNAGGGGSANFNLNTGVATLNSGVSASMQNYGNGWWRCALTYTSNATGSHNVQIRLCDASGNATYSGTGNQGAYIFGAQLEVGSVATSYIPTTAGTGSRSADVISVTGAVSGAIGQTEGTIYCEFEFPNTDKGDVIRIDSGSDANIVEFVSVNSTAQRARIKGSSGSFINLVANPANMAINTRFKIAIGYKTGDFALYINGVSQSTDASAVTFNAAFNRVLLGPDVAAGRKVVRIFAAALYTTRLTNAQLEFLTSPYTSYSQMATTLSYTIL